MTTTVVDHIHNVIHRESKDADFGVAVCYFLRILKALDIEFIVMGSTALHTHFDYFHRLPGDFDIAIREVDIEKLRLQCDSDVNLRFEQHPVASKVHFRNKVYMHLIPEMMNIVDKTTDEIFLRVNIFHLDRTEYREINLVSFQRIPVRVPVVEYMFCLYVSISLDSNVFSDNVTLLEQRSLNDELVREYMDRVPGMRPVIEARLKGLRTMLKAIRPDLVDRVPSLDAREPRGSGS